MELDPICKRVSETIIPEKQLVHLADDTGLVGNLTDDIRADLFIDTSPCQPWSRCRGDAALGFGDARSQTFIDSHAIYNRLRRNNPDIKRIIEVSAKHLAADLQRMETMSCMGRSTL